MKFVFSSVVQAYTQPYSICGRLKLIICQIRHELSITIHKISTSWKKKLDGGPYIIPKIGSLCSRRRWFLPTVVDSENRIHVRKSTTCAKIHGMRAVIQYHRCSLSVNGLLWIQKNIRRGNFSNNEINNSWAKKH